MKGNLVALEFQHVADSSEEEKMHDSLQPVSTELASYSSLQTGTGDYIFPISPSSSPNYRVM